MPTHEQNIAVFEDTKFHYENDELLITSINNSIINQRLINEEDEVCTPADKYTTEAKITINTKRTYEAARGYDCKVAALNFASAVHPGGGVAWGSNAQEESMCRLSTLLPCIEVDEFADSFYNKHRLTNDRRNNDDCIYTPDVVVFKDDSLSPTLLDEDEYYKVNVITCAAPDLREIHVSDNELAKLHEKRMRRIFNIAANEGNEVIIIGAFGCGAFGNDAKVVAKAIKKVCDEYKYKFKEIVCAVYCAHGDYYNYDSFVEAFEDSTTPKRNIYKDGLYGVAVGDALGVPVEFTKRQERIENPVTTMLSGGYHNQPIGTWSDDTSMTLCLAYSLASNYVIDYSDIMRRFINWLMNKEYCCGHEVFDCGITVSKALLNAKNKAPTLCGLNDYYSNGNGSLMRILPMVYVVPKEHYTDLMKCPALLDQIHDVSSITHGHAISKSACGIYINIACHILSGEALEDAIKNGAKEALEFYNNEPSFMNDMNCWSRISNLASFKELPIDEIQSSGFVVHSLEASLYCLLTTSSYKEAVLKAVNLGDDTDTTGAITGGLAGLYYGYDSIPSDWIEVLRGKEIIDKAIRRFMNK